MMKRKERQHAANIKTKENEREGDYALRLNEWGVRGERETEKKTKKKKLVRLGEPIYFVWQRRVTSQSPLGVLPLYMPHSFSIFCELVEQPSLVVSPYRSCGF